MEHIVTRSTYRGHTSARCTCGARWAPIGHDGGIGNRRETEMLQHMRQVGGKFSDS